MQSNDVIEAQRKQAKLDEFRNRLEQTVLMAEKLLPPEDVYRTFLAIGVSGLEKLNGKEYIGHFLNELGIELMLSPTESDGKQH